MARTFVTTLFACWALSSFGAPPLPAQQTCNLPIVARDSLGPVTSVASDGAYLYVYAGGSLVVYGLADPEHPSPLGRLDLDFEIRQFDVVGPLLAAAAGEDGVLLIDVSNRALPTLAFRFETPGYVAEVDVRGSTVFVARDSDPSAPVRGALLILDATDPAAPALIGSRLLDVGVGVSNVMVRGQTAFTLAREFPARLEILDVSNPSSPALLGDAEVIYGFHQIRVNAVGTFVYLYTLSPGYNGGTYVTVFDTHDRAQPAELTTFGYSFDDLSGLRGILLGGSRLYVAGHDEEDLKLWVYDVSTPAQPTILGEAALPSLPVAEPASLARDGETLFAAGSENGTLVLDVSAPTAPTLLGRVPTSGPLSAISLQDRIALLRSHDAARALDLRRAADPVELGSSPLVPLSRDDIAQHDLLARDGDLGLAADRGGLEILDLSDPSAIVPYAYVPMGGDYGPGCAIVRGSLAFVGLGAPQRLRVFDLSDPTAPVALGSFLPQNGSACPLALDGDLLLSGSPCAILDVTDPANPSRLGSCPADSGRRLVLEGTTAYLGDYGALLIYDLTDPVHPAPLGGIPLALADLEVVHARGYLSSWTAAGDPQLRVYDLRDPGQIHLDGIAPLPATGAAVRAESGRILVTHRNLGYSVLADCPFFADGFESGDASAWSSIQP